MKKFFAYFLIGCCAFFGSATSFNVISATETTTTEETTSNQVEFVIKDGVLIDYIGDVADVVDVVIPDGVTVIGSSAFSNCYNLKTVILPKSVVEIEDGAFAYSGVESVELPESLQLIGSSAFHNCLSLQDIIVPDTVKYIGGGAFKGCTNLADEDGFVIVNGILFDVLSTATLYEVFLEIPNTVKVIGSGTFDEFNRSSFLNTVYIPDSVQEIQSGAFSLFPLDEVIMPDNVPIVEEYAFSYSPVGRYTYYKGNEYVIDDFVMEEDVLVQYTGLAQKVVIPDGVREIGQYAFYGSDVTKVQIPDTVERIGKGAFRGCSELKEIYLPEKVTSVEEQVFYYSGVNKVQVSEKVNSIGKEAFYGCWNLQEINVPKQLKNIGKMAFKGCSGLKNEDGLVIVNGILFDAQDVEVDMFGRSVIDGDFTTIAGYALSGYPANPAFITISEGVEEIEDYAFDIGGKIKELTLPLSVKKIGDKAFPDTAINYVVNYYKGNQAATDYVNQYETTLYTSITVNIRYDRDIEGDGVMELSDARLVLRQAVLLEELLPEQKEAADVDKDGEITLEDARLVLRQALLLDE